MGMKEAYQEKATSQLREWQSWIRRYQSDPTLSRRNRWSGMKTTQSRLEECYHIAQVRLEELGSAGGVAWEQKKQAVEQAMIDLKRALDESGACEAGEILRLQIHRKAVYEPFERKE